MKHLLLATMFLVSLSGCEPGNIELPIGPAPKGSVVTVAPSAKKSSARFAMVSTPGFPGDCLPGAVRKEPWGEMVTTIPSGTLVWVDTSKVVPDKSSHAPKKWWHIRFYEAGTPISGWMHGDILKPPVWKEPEAPIDDLFSE